MGIDVWSERRTYRSEGQRHRDAEHASKHLPVISSQPSVSDADFEAMRYAHAARFDEDLPHTETLMKVAMIGYRMALRDMGNK